MTEGDIDKHISYVPKIGLIGKFSDEPIFTHTVENPLRPPIQLRNKW